MSVRPFITIGDRTTHGGVVIEADFTTDTHGKPMSRTGDLTVCRKCRGTFPITTGASDMSDGQGHFYARHMDETACGAKLISGQIATDWDGGSNDSADASASPADGAALASSPVGPRFDATSAAPGRWPVAAPTDSGICLQCLLAAAEAGSALVIRE